MLGGLRVVTLLVFFLLASYWSTEAFLYGDSNGVSIAKWLNGDVANKNPLIANSPQISELEVENVQSNTISKSTEGVDYLQSSSCQLVQIVHLLHQVGCQPKAIASYACSGSCPSYVQVSTSKFWQHERSCSCCQQTGLKEATFTLDCPSLDPPYKKVKTYAPVDCMCRACTDIRRENLKPQELVDAIAGETILGVKL